jgi:Acyl-CoA reductase (LuxC)
MQLEKRKKLLVRLGEYMLRQDDAWTKTKEKAYQENRWFIPEFISLAVENIALNFLQPEAVENLVNTYDLPDDSPRPKKVGIVMAGNIPLVGFHDFLCVFLTGHIAFIKPSSKDEALIKHLVQKLIEWESSLADMIQFGELLKGCDAYIATGSNNTSRYFEHYFQKYPHIIRRNRTSVAILTGNETKEELEKLADDVYQYFGLGCRNVTKIYVPIAYDFVPFLQALNKYDYLANHNKYKNNYDYNLAILLINNRYYMTNGSILLVEESSITSPISQLNYEFYLDKAAVQKKLHDNEAVQCVVSDETTAFGKAQQPAICDFADGVDTMAFLKALS